MPSADVAGRRTPEHRQYARRRIPDRRQPVEAIEREIFDPGRSAKAGRLADQPVGGGLVARRGGAMDALSIPCGQPRRRAGRAVVCHVPLNPRR
jgi:hypothetical protein